MQYYHDLITQKSWEELQRLSKEVDFVLIGGWAVYLYTKTLKSKDIDILVGYDQLPLLERSYQLSKNDRLKKYEAVKDLIQIDIYLPYYSEIGIPVEELLKHVQNIEGFTLLEINYLTVLKIYTLKQRGYSSKGRKDFIDLIALINLGRIDFIKLKRIIERCGLESELVGLRSFLDENFDLPELDLNQHIFSKIKKRIRVKLIGN